ncbi:hypothetical protein [Salinigranum rubrum]|uniref:hypothetical protein n=1 Tax=Salinigranum rubrum TaxID=755307 RepID=UPI0013A59C84|nr:hypothetical protein [Salinigranum rubrum]
MTDDSDESLADRVTVLERQVSALESELRPLVNHDLPLVIGAVRALVDEDISELNGLPAAARRSAQHRRALREDVNELSNRVAALGDIGTGRTSKEEKFAAVLAFAFNKRGDGSKVTVTPEEIRGCTGVSRRYAYELVEAMGESVTGCRVRESEVVQTAKGSRRKSKALLVDCEVVQHESVDVSEFTTGGDE